MFFNGPLVTSVLQDVSKVVGTILTLAKSGGDMSHLQITPMMYINTI